MNFNFLTNSGSSTAMAFVKRMVSYQINFTLLVECLDILGSLVPNFVGHFASVFLHLCLRLTKKRNRKYTIDTSPRAKYAAWNLMDSFRGNTLWYNLPPHLCTRSRAVRLWRLEQSVNWSKIQAGVWHTYLYRSTRGPVSRAYLVVSRALSSSCWFYAKIVYRFAFRKGWRRNEPNALPMPSPGFCQPWRKDPEVLIVSKLTSEHDKLEVKEHFKETYMAILFGVLGIFRAGSSQENRFLRSRVVLFVSRGDTDFIRSS